MRGAALCLIVLLTGALSARAETRIERTLKIDAGGRLEVETGIGAITVTGTSRPDVHVVVTSGGKQIEQLLALQFQDGGKTARIVGRSKAGFFNWFSWSGNDVRFEIEVPSATVLNLNTSGGAITVRDLSADVDGHTSGGGVQLKSIKGRVHVTTSGGSIEGTDLSGAVDGNTSGGGITMQRVSGDLRVHTSGGGIEIENAGGLVDANTSGGGIRASFARGNSRGGRLESSGGSIHVSVDSKADLEIEAEGNDVRTDLPLQTRSQSSRERLQGTLGKGGQTLRVRTSGGDIAISAIR